MALSGALKADFSQFVTEAQRAEVALSALTKGSESTGKAFDKMVVGFSGAKVIQEAGLMAAVFDAAGGAAKFTAAELARMGSTGAEAVEKLTALGVAVPPGILRIATATKDLGAASADTGGKVNTLGGALNQFDGVLAAMGVHMGPEIRALGELGTASGKTSSDLGLLGTAGLVVGAAIGGWKIGRAVAEFFDLDTKIGNAAASLLGWGSVADQVAGVKADALALASRRIGFEVTTMSTALAINAGWQDKWASNAEISAAKVAGWHAELAKVSTDLPSLTADLASHNFSLQDLAKRYNVSVEALQFFGRETTAAAAAEKAASDSIHANNTRLLHDQQAALDATKAWRGAMEELNSSGQGWKGTLDTIDGAVVEAIKGYLAAGVSQAALATAYGLTAVQVKSVASLLREETDEQKRATAARQEATRITDAATAAEERLNAEKAKAKQRNDAAAAAQAKLNAEIRAMGGSTQYDLGTAEGRSSVPADVARLLHDGYSFKQANLLAYALRMGFDASHDPILAIKGPAVPGFEAGGSTGRGGLSMLHPGEYVVPKDGVLVSQSSSDRALWDQLNAQQAALWLANGRQVDAQQQAIIDRMRPLTPAGFGDRGGTGGGGSITNHFYLVDNTETLARKVADTILRQQLRRGPI